MAESVVRRGSVVLIRYPFTDLSGSKVRPAVVLTPDSLLSRLDDVLCLFISSVVPEDPLPSDIVVDRDHPAFAKLGLRRPSVLRSHKLALLHKSLLLRKVGDIDAALEADIDQGLRLALGLSVPEPSS